MNDMKELIREAAKAHGLSLSEREMKILVSQYKKLMVNMKQIEAMDLNEIEPVISFMVGAAHDR